MGGAREIIEYWFGYPGVSTPDNGRLEMWFGKNEETDRTITERFEETVEAAGRGELDAWIEKPESCIALIIVLDQFPRNIYRESGNAFAFDRKAREAAAAGLERGFDLELPLHARVFFYLPLEHSEDLDHQKLSVEMFGKLLHDAPEELKETFTMVYNYALRHHEIIERFGRFPHRNDVLGRESTAEEIEFLKEPNSSF